MVLPHDDWAASALEGELQLHIVEGRNLTEALTHASSRQPSRTAERSVAVRVSRPGDRSFITGARVLRSTDKRVAFDSRITFRSPPYFDLEHGKLEFELVDVATGLALARSHVALPFLIHVESGQTHTIDLLIVPSNPSSPPIKLPHADAPGIKVVIFPKIPKAPSPANSVTPPHLPPQGSTVYVQPSPRRSPSLPPEPPEPLSEPRLPSPDLSPRNVHQRGAFRAVRCLYVTVSEGKGIKAGQLTKVLTQFHGSSESTSIWEGRSPSWGERLSHDVPPGRCSDLDNEYLHVRLLEAESKEGPWRVNGSVDIELGHVMKRTSPLDMWLAMDAGMRSRLLPGRDARRGKGDQTQGSVQTAVNPSSTAWLRLLITFEEASVVPAGVDQAQYISPALLTDTRSMKHPGVVPAHEAQPVANLVVSQPPRTSPPAPTVPQEANEESKRLAQERLQHDEQRRMREHHLHLQEQQRLLLERLEEVERRLDSTHTPRSAPRASQSRGISPPRPGKTLLSVAESASLEVVVEWLASLGLDNPTARRVGDQLASHGICTLAALMKTTDSQLSHCGVPLGCRRKILHALGIPNRLV